MLRCADLPSSPSGPGSLIKNGDHVIVYLGPDNMKAATVDQSNTFNCRFGSFRMQAWLGKPYGCKVESQEGRFVYLLFPTPELWTQVLRHRTQILYTADISLITCMLELKPGCTVLESGTGSGSLTHALARAVGPGGQVHTFEFHSERCKEAEAEFRRHKLEDLVSIAHRDIESLGFPEELHEKADGVFLDLPGPWKVVSSAANCLRSDGVFCSFSPCMEQVHKTCGALSQAGFHSIKVMECLLRQFEVRAVDLITDVLAPSAPKPGPKRKRSEAEAQGFNVSASRKTVTAKPLNEARGHTGYLTVARRIVREAEVLEEVQPEVQNDGPDESQT